MSVVVPSADLIHCSMKATYSCAHFQDIILGSKRAAPGGGWGRAKEVAVIAYLSDSSATTESHETETAPTFTPLTFDPQACAAPTETRPHFRVNGVQFTV